MDETTECIAIHNTEAKCNFYQNTTSCHSSQGLLDYMYFIFCYLQPQYSWGGVVLCLMWLCLLFIGLGVTADDFLCPSLVVITKTLHLSQNIAGVTFLAFGNGAPDIFSSVAGTEQNRPELVIGTLFGAGIFVTSVVAGSIIVSKPFKIMERPFLRDIIFYVCAAFWTFLRFYYGEVTLWHSIGFVCLYILYILVVIISRIIYNRYKSKKAAAEVPEIEIEAPGEQSTEVEPKVKVEKKLSVTFQPTGEDNPEAAGVVLRRFSFRGSISIAKKRHSSVHSHHEHVIRALTQSVECHTNPAFTNGHLPPPLDSQISKNSLSSLLSSTGELTMVREFILHIFPIDIEAWKDKKWPFKIFDIIKAPVYFLLIITIPVVDYENDKNNWCRPLNIIHIFTSPMFVLFALGEHSRSINNFPVWGIILMISFTVAVTVFWTSNNDNPPMYHCFYGYVGFGTSVVWVYLIASEIVSLLQTIGVVFRLSDTILGLTVLAWGNSIGDFISNLSVARQGYPRMGISACYGGPLLNLLLGIGIPYTVVIVKTGAPLRLKYDKLITLLYGSLTTILLTTIITMTILRFHAKRNFGILLICMYLTFLTAAIILETGVI